MTHERAYAAGLPTDRLLDSRRAGRWQRLPAWLLSLAVHLLAMIVACILFRDRGPRAPAIDPERRAEIVLAAPIASSVRYFSDEASASSRVAKASAETATRPGAGSQSFVPAASAPPTIPGLSLPELAGGAPLGENLVVQPEIGGSRGRPSILPGLDDEAILAEDAAIPRKEKPNGPMAPVSLFGSATAEGRSFVFVIDRSQSMGGDGLGALSAAAAEFSAQHHRLTAAQTMQVIAYNQATAHLTGRELIPATEENQERVVRFVADLAAVGQTEHSRGLLAALRLKPEVIFLLTDGGEPHLKESQFRVIREQAAGETAIHCIHFGRGKRAESDHFLMRLARENGGSYVYVDMNAR